MNRCVPLDPLVASNFGGCQLPAHCQLGWGQGVSISPSSKPPPVGLQPASALSIPPLTQPVNLWTSKITRAQNANNAGGSSHARWAETRTRLVGFALRPRLLYHAVRGSPCLQLCVPLGCSVSRTHCGTPKPSAMLRLGKKKGGSGRRVLFYFFLNQTRGLKGLSVT